MYAGTHTQVLLRCKGRQTRQHTCRSSRVSFKRQELWLLYWHYVCPSSLFPLSLHPLSCDLMYLPLCDWSQQMNEVFIRASPPRSLCASIQNMLHCHQSGTRRAGLDPLALFHPSPAMVNTRPLIHVEWMTFKSVANDF